MSVLAQKCKCFQLKDEIGVCTKLDCICRCFLCSYVSQCKWVGDCSSLDWTRADDARDCFLTASRKLRDMVRNKIRDIPKNELVGGLLSRREESLLRAFTIAPGDIIEVQIVQKYLKNVPDLPASMVEQTDRFTDFFNLLVFRDSFDRERKKIENGDLKIFATAGGLEQLQKMVDSPRSYINDVSLKMRELGEGDKKPSFEIHNNVMHVWTKQMVEPLRWSLTNNSPLEIVSAEHRAEIEDIIKHMEDLGKTVEKAGPIFLDKRACFERSYRIYNSLVAIFRCLYRESKEIRKAIESLAAKSTTLNLAFKNRPDIENWELLVAEAYSRLYSRNYLFDYDVPSAENWQTKIPEGAFWASALCFLFIFTNRERVILNRYSRGWVFEEKLRTELIDRNVKILHKNFTTPLGDIDYICRKDGDFFAIEAKDYTPWYRDWYLGSKIFGKRKDTLGRRMNQFKQRVNWLNNNLEKAGISKNAIPICISLYAEEAIEIGISFDVNELNRVFGASNYPTYEETLPQYEVSKDRFKVRAMGREIYGHTFLGAEDGKKALRARQCPIYPSCVALFQQDNPWLKDSGAIGELCLALQKTFGGGSCPNFEALCMWAGFCHKGKDPSEFAKQLDENFSCD